MNDLQLSAVAYAQATNSVWCIAGLLTAVTLGYYMRYLWHRHMQSSSSDYGLASILCGFVSVVGVIIAVACFAELYAIWCGPAYFAAKYLSGMGA